MSKTTDMFVCNKMYSNVCSTNLAGQKNCDCCDYNFDKCNNCCNKDTSMCKKCIHQKMEVNVVTWANNNLKNNTQNY